MNLPKTDVRTVRTLGLVGWVALSFTPLLGCHDAPSSDATGSTPQPLSTCPGTSDISTHAASCDAGGKLLSWAPGTGDKAYDSILGLNANYFAHLPNVTATDDSGQNPLSVKPWIATSYLCTGASTPWSCSPKGAPAGWPQNNAGLNQMMMEAGLAYYAYKGDSTLVDWAVDFLQHHLQYGMTAGSDSWSKVPYTDGTTGHYRFHGNTAATNGVGDGDGYLEPEKVAAMGYAFAKAYEYKGTTVFRDTAVHIANQMYAHQRLSGLSNTVSPWSFRATAATDTPRDALGERYASNVVDALRLYTEVIQLGKAGALAGAPEYDASRLANWQSGKSSALGWLLGPSGPIQDANHAWAQYFEDVEAMSDLHNVNQLVPMETAKFLMDNPGDDPNWQTHVAGLLSWVEAEFAVPVAGANSIREQKAFWHPMGSHTARYAAVNARFAELTGDAAAREKAFRAFNWATYMVDTDGMTIDGPNVQNIWFSDSLGDFQRHFLIGMGASPDWAPAGQNHLVRAQSVVRSISYAPAQVTYETYEPKSREVLRLAFAPARITAGGAALPRITDLESGEGWTLTTGTDDFGNPKNIVRIRHDASGRIVVSGTNTAPTVTITSPTAGQSFPAPATLALEAQVTTAPGRAIPPNGVDFRIGTEVLCTAPQTSSPFACTASRALSDGGYVITVRATDSAGETGQSAVTISVASPSNVLLGNRPSPVPTTVDYETPGVIDAWAMTASGTGNVGSLNLYVDVSNTATSIGLGIYDAGGAGGNPGARLGSCTASAQASTAGWVMCAVAPGVRLTSGTRYWFAILGPSGGGTVRWREQAATGGTYLYNGGGVSSLPASFGTVAGSYPGAGIAAYAASGN